MVHHIYLQGIVGEAITKKSVISSMSGVKSGDTVELHIHSYGGDVNEGWAIHDYFKSEALRLGLTLNTVIEGVCMSIATIFFAIGKSRIITPNSKLMIHNPWGENVGDAASMIRYAEALTIEEDRLANFYASSIGAKVEQVKKWMAVETEYNAQQAVSMGFATGTHATKPEPSTDGAKAQAIFNLKTNNKPMSKQPTSVKAFLAKAKRALQALSGEIKAYDTTLEDGTAITIESESELPEVGDMVTMTETGEPAPDGTHVLADGTSIVVVAGAITEVIAAVEANADVVALQARVTELEAENATLVQALEVAEPILASVRAASGTFSPKAATNKPRVIGAAAPVKASASVEVKDIKKNQRREPVKA